MAQTLYYGGNKSTTIPGVYTEFRSGIDNAPLQASFGNVLIIDTGKGSSGYRGSGFSGGAGVAGELKSGVNAIQNFTRLRDYRKSIVGSELWLLGEPLFQPNGAGNGAGIPSINFIKAAATTAATITYTFTGGASNGGTFVSKVRDEGYVGNGFEYDQTYATSTITISDAGDENDTISITVSGVTIASYTVGASDAIADTIAGLSASVVELGLATVSATTATTIVITDPNFLTGALANTVTPAVVTAGTVAGSAAQFTGGVDGTILTRGYAGVMRAGTIDTAKFAIDFYRGTFKGLDSESEPWDFITEALCEPELICSSVEFSNVSELFAWAATDSTYQFYFDDSTTTTAGTGAVTIDDLTANAGNILAAGGTETYSTTHLDTVLDNITDLDYTFVLSLDNATNAQSSDNSKILTHLTDEATYRKFMVVGGADDDTLTGSNSSSETAAFYDSPRVIVVHSGVGLSRRGASGFKNRSSLYKAALVIGKIGGQAPQIPLTFKSLNFQKDRHELNIIEQKTALANGVLATKFDKDFGGYIILQGINSKQSNDFTIADDGTSFEISIESIKAQVAKELEINAKIQLLGQSSGVNRNTLSAVGVGEWTKRILSTFTATDVVDNYITAFRNVTVETVGDTYRISYEMAPSFPVNKLVFVGVIVEI